jgi:hypothetical protein
MLEQSLLLAGDHRAALERVLARYSQNPADSLKHRAAVFLISNMAGHYSFANDMMEGYYNASDSVTKHYRSKSLSEMKAALDSISRHVPRVPSISDLQKVEADYLIANIERAFNDWQHGYFARQLSFDDFCEYLLPYKVAENQTLDNWREYMAEVIHYYEAYLPEKTYAYGDLTYATGKVKEFYEDYQPHVRVETDGLPLRRLKSLWNTLKYDDCSEKTIGFVAAMRSIGIPSAMDFRTLPNRAGAHVWCVAIDEGNNTVPFKSDFYYPASKIFRRTFAINPELLELLSSGEDVPPQLRYLCVKDVTDQYLKATDVVVPVQKTKNKFAYLATFDNKSWQIVGWGKVKGRKAYFNKLGGDVAYLPVTYSNSGAEPIAPPFILTLRGEVKPVVADTLRRQALKLHRKYPPMSDFVYSANRIVGSKFQAASKPDFSDAVTLHTVDKFGTESDEIFTKTKVKYRYWRHLSAPEGWSAVGEIYFFRKGENITQQGKIVGTENDLTKSHEFRRENAFDGEPLTHYYAPVPTGGWTGVDFGEPTEVDRILYAPLTDANGVTYGDEYELSFWDEDRWTSLGKKKADNVYLTFDSCPAGALFLLHNHTRGVEDRIFTYENGKQVFW